MIEGVRELTRVLSDPAVSVLVVEYRDGLTRFGFAATSHSSWSPGVARRP